MPNQAKSGFDVKQWIDYIQTLHTREMDLTLERVAEVYTRMIPAGAKFQVVTIAGTNGKGSTAEIIASIFREAGYKVGKYTSPHIIKFNERMQINGIDIEDEDLLVAFNRIEAIRENVNLTFFEFGTLMAIDVFSTQSVDVAVMEVGLGGRLDATNILEPDVAVVSSISIDHTAWLGNNLEGIAAEKIAIARLNKPCILGMQDVPISILKHCQSLAIEPLVYGRDFISELSKDELSWEWQSKDIVYENLELPYSQIGHQLVNASIAIQAVLSLESKLPVPAKAIKTGIKHAKTRARCELVSNNPSVVLDVSHNVGSVAVLLDFIEKLNIKGKIIAVCGMLQDKQIVETLSQLIHVVDEWYFATIKNERGATARQLAVVMNDLYDNSMIKRSDSGLTKNVNIYQYESANDAYIYARQDLQNDDCLIVFGSFYIVSDIIEQL